MFSDLTAFVQDHRSHGQLVGDASEPGWNGYRITGRLPVRGHVRAVGDSA
jgi:hypothetical protein